MVGNAIRIAIAVILAAASVVGAIAIFRGEMTGLTEVSPPKKQAALAPAPNHASAPKPAEEASAGFLDAAVAPEALAKEWTTLSVAPDAGVSEPPEILVKSAAPLPEPDGEPLQDSAAISYNIGASRAEIVENLSSPRARMTKESVNTIFNHSIRGAFSKAANAKSRFDASSGNLRLGRGQSKTAIKTVNLYEIGSALGGEAYLCIAAAKLHCVQGGQNDKECEHPERVVLQNCVNHALQSAGALIASQLQPKG